MKIWAKLDEVIGAGMLTSVAIVAMFIGYNSGITQMCVTGIVALLAAKVISNNKGGDNNGSDGIGLGN